MSKIKRLIAILSLTALVATIIPASAMAATFSDVPETNEFYTYVEDLAARGVVSGIDGMYYPTVGVSRSELTKMSLNAFGIAVSVPAGAPHFSDVPETHTLYEYVETAYGLGIVSGYGDGTFRPDQDILRQEGMKVIVETARSVDTEGNFDEDLTGAPHFTDVAASSEFYGYIETAYNLGIINGYAPGLFGPMLTMQRDQMAKVVSNAIYVYENGKPSTPAGQAVEVVVEASEDAIYPDGVSTSTLTATVVDGNGNRVGNYTDPVTFTTDLGTFGETDDDTVTENADGGRAQVSLRSATEEGTATITVDTGSFDEATVEVEFSRDAPVTRSGFGSNTVSGVGTITLRLTEERILTEEKSDDNTGTFIKMCGGLAQGEVILQDDEGNPISGSNTVQVLITEGTGALYSSVSNCTPASSAVRALTLTGSTSTSANAQGNNGRYYFYYKVLSDMAEDTVTIQAVDLDTSPTLNVDADLEVVNPSLEATVYHGDILTRNDTQISGDTATIQNTSTVYLLLTDENDEPMEVAHEIEVRLTGGPTSGVRLLAEGTSDTGTNDYDTIGTVVNAALVEDNHGYDIPGLYAYSVLAGSAEGTVTTTATDVTAISNPSVTANVTMHDPTVDCYASSTEVPEGTDSTIVCRMTDDDGMPVTSETLRLQIQGGDGAVDTTLTNSSATATAVNMASLTYGSSTATGWYYAEYEAEDNVPSDDTISLKVLATDRAGLPSDTLTVVATDDNPSAAADLEVVSLRNNIGPSTNVAVVAFVRDNDGVGISTLCTGTGATSVDTGFNGILRINPNTMSNMSVNTGVTEFGAPVQSGNCPATNTGHGNGAYWSVVTSANVNDAGEVEYELYNSSAVLVEDVEEPFNILDYSLTSSTTMDTVLIDEGFGIINEIIDESNDDPVTGLTGSGVTVTSIGTTVTGPAASSLEGSFIEVGCDSSACPTKFTSGDIDGTGLYVILADTTGDVNAGDNVEVTVTYTNSPTDPADTVTVAVEDLDLELSAYPEYVETTNSIAILGRMRDPAGDYRYVDPNDISSYYIQLEISDGSGEICNNNLNNGCSTGSQRISMVALDANANGNVNGYNVVYLATYEADVVSETVELTGRVVGTASLVEDTLTIDVL